MPTIFNSKSGSNGQLLLLDNRRINLIALIIFLTCLIASVMLSKWIERNNNLQFQNLVDSEADSFADLTNNQLREFFFSLDRMRGRWESSAGISDTLWMDDAKTHLDDFSYLRAIALADSQAQVKLWASNKVSQRIGFPLISKRKEKKRSIAQLRLAKLS